MRILTALLLLLLTQLFSFAQSVGIGTAIPNASAKMEISSNNSGLLIPRMTTSGIFGIPSPAKGLMVLDTVLNQLMINMGASTLPIWQTVVAKSGWSLNGNSGTNPVNQFIGTVDNQPLKFRLNNINAGEWNIARGNIFLGKNAGLSTSNNAGDRNIAIGEESMSNAINQHGIVAIGDSTLVFNGQGAELSIEGVENTAIGSKALRNNAAGAGNTGIGFQALKSNVGGYSHTAVGAGALEFTTLGSSNTAFGHRAMRMMISGENNIAIGVSALANTTGGNFNIAIGSLAMNSTSTSFYNIAVGAGALRYNTSGRGNTAVGTSALSSNTASWYNTAIGYDAALQFDLGYNNTILGANCDANQAGLFNVIGIGQAVTNTASSQARIGNSSTNSIGGFASWSNLSDGKFKQNITENVKGLEFIMKLKPVTYNLNISALSEQLNETRGKEMDPFTKKAIEEKEQMLFSGFVAQEVEKAAREVGYDFSGVDKPKNDKDFYSLRYGEFVVPIVKAMQEQQQMIESMNRRIQLLEEQNTLLLQLLNKKDK